MSFGLGRGRRLDVGAVGVTELPPLPDNILEHPGAGRVDPRAWFPNPDRPLEIEIGSGKGTFLLAHGADRPGVNLLGIEWAREFYEYAADRAARAGLDNVRLLNTDAVEFIRWRCPDAAATVIHLYFPDPWPKARHHKRRTVSDRFLADAWRVLSDAGELRVVTDHDDYWAWMNDHFDRACVGPALFERLPFAPAATAGADELVGTNFERKYRREGRPFHAAVLRKVAP